MSQQDRILRVSNVNTGGHGTFTTLESVPSLNDRQTLSNPNIDSVSGSKLKRLSLVARPLKAASSAGSSKDFTTLSTPESKTVHTISESEVQGSIRQSVQPVEWQNPQLATPTTIINDHPSPSKLRPPSPPLSSQDCAPSPSFASSSTASSSLSPRIVQQAQRPITPRRVKSSISYSPSIKSNERLEGSSWEVSSGGPSVVRGKERTRWNTSDSSRHIPGTNGTIVEGDKNKGQMKSSEDDGHEDLNGESRRAHAQTLTEKHADLLRLIAMRERRVNELRQELAQQEASLSHLRSRWALIVSRSQPYHNNPAYARSTSSLSSLASSIDNFDVNEFSASLDNATGSSGALGGLGIGLGLGLGIGSAGVSGAGGAAGSGVGAMITALGVSEEKTAAAIQEGKKFWGQLMRTVGAAAGGTVPLNFQEEESRASLSSSISLTSGDIATNETTLISGSGGMGLSGLKSMLPPIPSFSLTFPAPNATNPALPPSNKARLRPEPVKTRPVSPPSPLNLSSTASHQRSRAVRVAGEHPRSFTQSTPNSGSSAPTSASSHSSITSIPSSAPTSLVTKKTGGLKLKRVAITSGGVAGGGQQNEVESLSTQTSTPNGSQMLSPNLIDGDGTEKGAAGEVGSFNGVDVLTPRRPPKQSSGDIVDKPKGGASFHPALEIEGGEPEEEGDGDRWGW